MKSTFLNIFNSIKKEDIYFGGKNNLNSNKKIKEFLDLSNEQVAFTYNHLLIHYMFYIYHVAYVRELLLNGAKEIDIYSKGYTRDEIRDAKDLMKILSDNTSMADYIVAQTIQIKNVEKTIRKIYANKPLGTTSYSIIESAKRRIAYAEGNYKDNSIRKAIMAYEG